MLLSACGKQSSPSLEGSSWILSELNGQTVLDDPLVTLSFTNGTHYFQTLSYYYTAPSAYTRIAFNFTYQKTSGIAWFDNAAVILLP